MTSSAFTLPRTIVVISWWWLHAVGFGERLRRSGDEIFVLEPQVQKSA